MDVTTSRRTEILGDTLRRLIRRGARSHIAKILGKMRPGDVAFVLRGMTPADCHGVFEVLRREYPEAAGDVLTDLDSGVRLELLERLGPTNIASILEQVAVDDAVFIVESLPDPLKAQVIELADLHDLDEVQNQLTYEDDTAGRIMDRELFSLPEETTVGAAIEALQGKQDVEMVFYIYVVDRQGKLVGVTSLRQLLMNRPERSLGEIAQRDLIKVHTSTDQEEVAQLAARYDLLAVPVTDQEGVLEGIVTVDDIVDVLKEEATEDFFKMVGSSDDELIYQERSLKVAGIRLPWLLFNLMGLFVAGVLVKNFQTRFEEVLFLLAFVPVVMGMGGNSGSQTSTLTVRGLATGRITLGQGRVLRFLVQQVKVGALLGLITGTVAALLSYFLEANPYYALVVSGALFLALVLSSVIGAVIPLVFEKLGIDPAVAAAPLVTTTSDITGILVYFGLAMVLIEQLIR